MSQPTRLGHRIGDAWLREGPTSDDVNPFAPHEAVARVPIGDADTARAAAKAARMALPDWARTPAPMRGDILYRASEILAARADEVAKELTREEGKTLVEGLGEVRRAAAILRYWAGRTLDPSGEVFQSSAHGTSIRTLRQPIGVVAVITPWNFPIAIPAWKIAPALAYGNTVVFKPASATPLVAQRLVEVLVDAGLPPGVLNLVHAPGVVAGDAWIAPDGVDALSFTGSEAAGRHLQARATALGIKVQLELGGKNAVIVAPDADLDRAAELIIRGGFASAGQKCTATSRVITFGDIAPPLIKALVRRTESLTAGDPLVAETTLGPVIDEDAVARIDSMVRQATSDGAKTIARGDVPLGGYFSPPILLGDVDARSPIATNEIFGPVVALLHATDLSAAIRLHNDVAFGLSGSIFTRDLATAETFIQSARVGMVHINGETAGAEPHVPFGGMKASSSWSREQGYAAEHFFTQTKTIYVEGLPSVGLFDLS